MLNILKYEIFADAVCIKAFIIFGLAWFDIKENGLDGFIAGVEKSPLKETVNKIVQILREPI